MKRREPKSSESRKSPSPAKKSSAQQGKKGRLKGTERVQEILDVSRMLFLSHGVENVSTRMIAKAIGISQPALYKHFETKQEILDRLVNQVFGELAQILQAIEQTGDQWVRQAIVEYLRFGLQHPDEYRLAFMLSRPYQAPHTRAAEQRTEIQALRRTSFRLLEDHLRKGIESGCFRSDLGSAKGVAQCLWGGMHGLVSLLLTRTNFPWEDHETLIAMQTRMLMNSILVPGRIS